MAKLLVMCAKLGKSTIEIDLVSTIKVHGTREEILAAIIFTKLLSM